MVLEAGEDPSGAAQLGLDPDVADQPRPLLADGLEVGDPEAGQPLLAELVAVPEQLVAAAYREQYGAVIGRPGKRLALGCDHVGGDRALVAILPAADVEEVMRGRVDGIAGAGARVGEPDPAPLAAPLQEDDVAAVGVDVHLVWIEG